MSAFGRESSWLSTVLESPLLLLLIALLLVSKSARAQESIPFSSQQGPPSLAGHTRSPANMLDAPDPLIDERRLRSLNIERQKSLVSDTNRLLNLVNELNAEIVQAPAASFTASQLRKMTEIEKLARNVRVKMSMSMIEPPVIHPPQFPRR